MKPEVYPSSILCKASLTYGRLAMDKRSSLLTHFFNEKFSFTADGDKEKYWDFLKV